MVFDFLAEYAWLPFAIAAIALFGGALTLLWHIKESSSRRYVYLLFVAMLIGSAGFILGGMQAGDHPVIPRTVLIPWVRLLWLIGGGLGVVFLGLYWVVRIDWRILQRRLG